MQVIVQNKYYRVERWQQFADGGNVWYDVSVAKGRKNRVWYGIKAYSTQAAAIRAFNRLTAKYNASHIEQI